MKPRLTQPWAAGLCAAILVLVALPVRAADRLSLEPAFGNTILSIHPDGRRARLWLNRDMTYSAQGRRGQKSAGIWRLKGGKLCLTQRKPTPLPFHYCKVLPKVGVGGHWSDIAVTGERVQNRLVAGR
jgi:hypothetical protein